MKAAGADDSDSESCAEDNSDAFERLDEEFADKAEPDSGGEEAGDGDEGGEVAHCGAPAEQVRGRVLRGPGAPAGGRAERAARNRG